MFTKCLTRSFWVFYENLFKGLATNMIFFIFIMGCVFGTAVFFPFVKANLFFTMIFHIILFSFFACTLLTGYYSYWIKIVRKQGRDNIFIETGRGIRDHWFKGLAVFIINVLFFAAVAAVVAFYKNTEALGKIGLVLGGIVIWLAIVFMVMQLYVMPVLILDEKKRIFTSYKKAALMVMSAPFSSFLLTGFIAYLMLFLYPAFALFFGKAMMPVFLALIALIPIFFLPFFTYNYILLLSINAAIISYEKYNVMEDMSKDWESKGWGNFFRPWESK